MINLGEVLRDFSVLTGLGEEECRNYAHECSRAADELKVMLKPDTDTVKHQNRLVGAVAELAYSRYIMHGISPDGVESFSAGDLRVANNPADSVQLAQMIRRNAFESVADLLIDGGFAFTSVWGGVDA